MNEQHDIRSQNETQFREIALRILEQAGFEEYKPEEKFLESQDAPVILKKDENIYWLETFYSRREQYTSRAILTDGKELIHQANIRKCLPLIVVGGVLSTALRGELLGESVKTVILDIQNLLYMARDEEELYTELVAQLPYSITGLRHRKPDYQPLPDWNAAYSGNNDWEITAASFRKDSGRAVVPSTDPLPEINVEADWLDDWGSDAMVSPSQAQKENSEDIKTTGNFGSGKSNMLSKTLQDLQNIKNGSDEQIDMASIGCLINVWLAQKGTEQRELDNLKRELNSWKGGKQSKSSDYEKLCTRTLMRLFADDLTLWKEQARSNDDLFRFDLICKIKRDNHKDFWEMAERYFSSKYIIFEFKNYSGKVTQKEVYTTVRYLYTKAMRGVAIIISPNGMDENAEKAVRGVLRDEGKLILSLTDAELVEMLRMKKYGEDPADFLSDKLDALLIDLEK